MAKKNGYRAHWIFKKGPIKTKKARMIRIFRSSFFPSRFRISLCCLTLSTSKKLRKITPFLHCARSNVNKLDVNISKSSNDISGE
ncbi:hypothetical protein QE152_g38830 [Popillia japonica]|uniref:Ribosomal protein L32 n=1 Tax=Popillia japonica TaxID=7064 RepID=A0AAW1HVP8_POPJA